ncbi:lysozyme [Sodalis endosymbiont of Spalangia cameroni]|uniref:lysozyme n=1 Tax=Sodalis praecaptivus TaxID=1239307 RepID=UPI0031F87E6E
MSRLSKAVITLIISGASAAVILPQFLNEKEANHIKAYKDSGGIWTICRGLTNIDGKPVNANMKFSTAQCEAFNKQEEANALAWVERNVQVQLSEPQKAAVASFCYWNIGSGKCQGSTFWRKLNAGDRKGACAELNRWVFDGGKDCRLTKGMKHGCYGQIERRKQEEELCLAN